MMNAGTILVPAVDADPKWLYRLGGIAALVFGISYILIFPLYAFVGAPPSDGDAWLAYGAGKTTVWWAILGLSVLTDFLLVPVALGLYLALRAADRNVMPIATAFVGLFIVLDLAVTWPNFAALITLSGDYAAAASDAERTAYVAAASYPSAVLSSTLTGVYSIVTLSLGILLIGIVMLKGSFSKATAYVGMATGILGVTSVAGPFLLSGLSATVIVASVLTTVWILLVGFRLLRLGQH